jgi:threonine/homoserine/homoserine lactone efflux protein
MWIFLTQGFAMGLYAAMQPGPFQTYILSETLRRGWRKSLPMAFAPLVSDLPPVLLTLLVLSRMPQGILDGLRIAGGLLMLYLARGAYKAFTEEKKEIETVEESPAKSLFSAAAINILSPSVYLFWTTIGAPIVLDGWQISPMHGLAFIIGMYAIFIPALAALIILFGQTGKLPAKAQKWIGYGLALLLALLGLYQIWVGVSAFIS